MVTVARAAATAALLGDPSRLAMLTATLDGRALTAGELARVAGVTPQTASGHLAQLTGAGLLRVLQQGRHRYYRLASAEVAQLLESLMQATAGTLPEVRVPPTGPKDAELRFARTCYDHLAGRLGVGLADALVERGCLELSPDGGALTPAGEAFLDELGVEARAGGGTPFCRPCLDWSERRFHLAGALGRGLQRRLLELGWIRKAEGSRAILVTRPGELALRRRFGLRLDEARAA
ncbi:transcriptional regulator, ArsR family [Tistlia consotensis]|uniref:Transcriptional regulator, ArsR family n=1 Tax=Tistlia consotensis USBA 355 TaxID=560819 RepID=A0A1Y6B9A4_9PROT|nr:winged helix-turn-helix domain-containing protein [Tistlia consotensis]SME91319.1 transcriptional regulator, ArsR family [Tistlia consotensis USBA 355]SNR27295.1 transcriptional regulator, ArsR family [Tistlia consotensis]